MIEAGTSVVGLFKAVLVVIGLQVDAEPVVLERIQLSSVEECERMKYQKEFTDFAPSPYVQLVFLCEWN